MSIKIMSTNLVDLDVVSNDFVSSEQASFPVTNVYNKQRRSKVWRSNGYWEILSPDNVIIFRESVGVDLTATVAVGQYVSTTAFLTAVKTALELVGASTYTVVTDTVTGKIKITSDGAGGGGIFQLMWTNVLSQGLANIMGFDITADQTGALTYLAGELHISTGEWIKWDFGISSNPTTFIMIGPRNKPLKITPGATITLQGNETDVWSAPSYETVLTYDDSVISKFTDAGLHTEALRYWRILIEDIFNPLGYVEVGSIYLGNHYSTTRGAVQFPLQSNQIDRSDTIFSEGGQTFSDIREKSQELVMSWFGLTKQELEALVAIFDEFGTSVPLFVSLDPDLVYSTALNKFVLYVKFSSPIQYNLVTPNNFSMQMTVREEL